MPTGEPTQGPARGYALLSLLVALAAAGAGLGHWGASMQQRLQREREAELNFRGRQIVLALESYRRADPLAHRRLPRDLHELLSDRRGTSTRHHLRRLWVDPFTGQADWVLLHDAEGGIRGLHSRARVQPLQRADGAACVCEWRFEVSSDAGAAVREAPSSPRP